jgi:signal peptidase I
MVTSDKPRTTAGRFRLRLLLTVLAILVMCWAMGLRLCQVHGPSMEPSYHDREIVLIARRGITLRKGDVVVVKAPGGVVIKRIYAEPGTRLFLLHDLNGTNGDQVVSPGEVPKLGKGMELFHRTDVTVVQLVVGRDELFLVGDNSQVSIDSRTFGPIRRVAVIGKVICPIRDQRVTVF